MDAEVCNLHCRNFRKLLTRHTVFHKCCLARKMSAIHFNKKCTTLFISILVLGAVKLLLDASRTLHQQTGPTTANTIPARRDDNLAINSISKICHLLQHSHLFYVAIFHTQLLMLATVSNSRLYWNYKLYNIN